MDLTGFVDGTENPQGMHRREVALVHACDDATFAGGSYLHVQRYQHNLTLWRSLKDAEQEDVYGRTKVDNIEYESDQKPLTAHTKRTSLKDAQGKSIEILRQSMPYGDMKQQGLFFISYCQSPEPFEVMLKSMIYGDGHGNVDSLLKYTQAETGAAFFAPSLTFLIELQENNQEDYDEYSLEEDSFEEDSFEENSLQENSIEENSFDEESLYDYEDDVKPQD